MNSEVGVYLNSSRAPDYFVSRDQAREMRKDGRFYSINHGKDIRQAKAEKPESMKSQWVTVTEKSPMGFRLGMVTLQLVR